MSEQFRTECAGAKQARMKPSQRRPFSFINYFCEASCSRIQFLQIYVHIHRLMAGSWQCILTLFGSKTKDKWNHLCSHSLVCCWPYVCLNHLCNTVDQIQWNNYRVHSQVQITFYRPLVLSSSENSSIAWSCSSWPGSGLFSILVFSCISLAASFGNEQQMPSLMVQVL